MGRLRQTLKGSVVIVTTTYPEPLIKQGLPTEISLDLDVDPECIGPWHDHQKIQPRSIGFQGYRYPEKVNHWFSVAIDKEVVLIRAASRQKCRARVNKFTDGWFDDQSKSFQSESPLTILNDASIQDLKSKVLEKKDVSPDFYLEREQFRSPIAIDLGTPWLEDSLAECRIGPILLRYCGPSVRCDCIRINIRKNCFFEDKEPYATLSTFRSLSGWGTLFANNHSCELLTSRAEYDAALPISLGYQSY